MKTQYLLAFTFIFGLTSCGQSTEFDGISSSSSLSGSIVISSVATDPATGAGIVSWWNPNGTFKSTLRDLFSGSEFATGLGFIAPDKIVASIEGVDRLEIMNLSTSVLTPITHVGLTATPLKQIAVDPTDSAIYIAEFNQNTVEKFTASGSRIGAPFLATTTGACSLSSPWGVTVIPSTQDVVVISSPAAAGRFSKYTKDGACVTHVTAAPFNSGTPQGVAYHPTTNKLLVTFATTHAIIAVDLDGTNPTTIYLNSAIINTPRTIATDAQGYIYVGSSGTDTIEKLYWSGTGSATRATSGPLIGPGVFSQNPTAITVIP